MTTGTKMCGWLLLLATWCLLLCPVSSEVCHCDRDVSKCTSNCFDPVQVPENCVADASDLTKGDDNCDAVVNDGTPSTCTNVVATAGNGGNACAYITTASNSICTRPCYPGFFFQQPVFQVRTSGRCSQSATADPEKEVTSHIECELASTTMHNLHDGMTAWPKDTSPIIIDHASSSPTGCFLDIGGSSPILKFNTNRGTRPSATSSYNLVCKETCPEREYQNEVGMDKCKECGDRIEDKTFSVIGSQQCDVDNTKCPVGMIGSTDLALTCRPCNRGYYNDEHSVAGTHDPLNDGTLVDLDPDLVCKTCPVGRYGPSGSSGKAATRLDDCRLCRAGDYEDEVAQEKCKECIEGKYSDQTGGVSIALGCKECSPGQYNQQTGRQSCKNCPGGYYQNQNFKATCKDCITGMYSSSGLVLCKDCEAGKYSDQIQQPICTSCEEGKFGTEVKQTQETSACSNCPGGKYQDQLGTTECVDCRAGLYSNTAGLKKVSECTPCMKGYYGDEAGKTTDAICLPCKLGFYNDDIGEPVCTGCAVGRYGDQTSLDEASACKECSTSKYNNQISQESCVNCHSGLYSNQKGLVDCKKCPGGRYGVAVGGSVMTDACSECSKGKYQPLTGQHGEVSCLLCIVGTYGTVNSQITFGKCKSCEPGRYVFYFLFSYINDACHRCFVTDAL